MITYENNRDEDVEIVLDNDDDGAVAPVRYEITSFGIDFDVEGLYRRLSRNEIVILGFQRNFVWSIKDASRFIESLLLGLPVPGIFLSRDFGSDKYVVIDGQQRLKSIQFFYDGVFNPSPERVNQRAFKLVGVQEEYNGLGYADLAPSAQFNLDNAVIHATVVKQESPEADDTSVYHIFDRINSSGRRLNEQEIRSAIYHGNFIDELTAMNDYPEWRKIFGRVHSRQRDQELILRFLAFYLAETPYQPPLSEFLNKFVGRHRNPPRDFLNSCGEIFRETMTTFLNAVESAIFRPERALNAAVFDSMSVGLARRIRSSDGPLDSEAVRLAYAALLDDGAYMDAVSRATADEQSVATRLDKAIERFALVRDAD